MGAVWFNMVSCRVVVGLEVRGTVDAPLQELKRHVYWWQHSTLYSLEEQLHMASMPDMSINLSLCLGTI